jgi:hypothetical protein
VDRSCEALVRTNFMSVQLSVILMLRNREPAVAGMVRVAVELGRASAGTGGFEVLALDENSGDNTLSLLSVLHGRVPELRTLQEVREGTAVATASRMARGEHCIYFDRLVDPELARWGVRQLAGGHRAAVVPGEILAVEARLGAHVLGNLYGGLVSAQQAVEAAMDARGGHVAWRPAPDRGLAERALLFVRRRLGWVGLGQLDRPLGT